MLTVESLCFDYPGTRALDDVGFTVAPHSITALVGPNGAGKTTLLRCIAGLAEPMAGRVLLDGKEVHEDPRAAHRAMGYLSDFFGLYNELTVAQCLRNRAEAQGVVADQSEALVARAATRCGIDDRLGQKAGTLSRGLRQRLAIAQAILHEPRLVLLDEPASGLDPEARQGLSNLLLELRDEGMTLVVSSHILAELRDYCSDLMIIEGGRLRHHGPVGPEAEAAGQVAVALELSSDEPRLAMILADLEQVTVLSVSSTGARLLVPAAPDTRRALLANLLAGGLPVCGFTVERADLQDAYLAHLREASDHAS